MRGKNASKQKLRILKDLLYYSTHGMELMGAGGCCGQSLPWLASNLYLLTYIGLYNQTLLCNFSKFLWTFLGKDHTLGGKKVKLIINLVTKITKMVVQMLSHMWLLETLWTAASWVPCPSPWWMLRGKGCRRVSGMVKIFYVFLWIVFIQ